MSLLRLLLCSVVLQVALGSELQSDPRHSAFLRLLSNPSKRPLEPLDPTTGQPKLQTCPNVHHNVSTTTTDVATGSTGLANSASATCPNGDHTARSLFDQMSDAAAGLVDPARSAQQSTSSGDAKLPRLPAFSWRHARPSHAQLAKPSTTGSSSRGSSGRSRTAAWWRSSRRT